MPFPLLLAAMFLSAASAGANAFGQSRVQQARDDAQEAERIRQQKYDQEATALNTQSQDRFKGFDDKTGDKAKELGDYFANAKATPTPGGDPNATAGALMPTSSSDIVNRESGKADTAASNFVGQQGQQLATMRSLGDILGDTSLLQARDAGGIGQIGGFKKGSAAVLPYELEAANHKGDMMGMIADLLGGGASVASSGMGGGNSIASMMGSTPMLQKGFDPRGLSATMRSPYRPAGRLLA